MLLTKIQESASKYPEQRAIQLKEGDSYRKHTYRELIGTVASMARALSQQGIGKGDRVALLSENRPEWVFSYLAVTSLGAVIVPLDAQLTEKEVAVLLADSGAKAVCVSAATRQKYNCRYLYISTNHSLLPRPANRMRLTFVRFHLSLRILSLYYPRLHYVVAVDPLHQNMTILGWKPTPVMACVCPAVLLVSILNEPTLEL